MGPEKRFPDAIGNGARTANRPSGSATGSVRRTTAFNREKIAVFTPMPSPSVMTIVEVTRRCLRSIRSA